MSDRNTQLKTLSSQLVHEGKLLRQLFDSLQQEHQCLSDKELDKLTAAVEAKQSILDEFNTAVSTRMEMLTKLGLDLEQQPQPEILKLIQKCAEEVPEISQHWEELEELLLQCKEQNAINGAVIEISSHSLQTAYTLLTAPTAGDADLYNAKGVSRKGGGSGNSIAKA